MLQYLTPNSKLQSQLGTGHTLASVMFELVQDQNFNDRAECESGSAQRSSPINDGPRLATTLNDVTLRFK